MSKLKSLMNNEILKSILKEYPIKIALFTNMVIMNRLKTYETWSIYMILTRRIMGRLELIVEGR